MFGRKEDFQILSYQKGGKPVYIRMDDPYLFNAMSEVNIKAFDSGLFKVFTGAKRLLTAGSTFSPAFRIANLLRDTIHTSVVSKSFMPFLDSAKGIVKVWKESPEYVSLMASGGGFGGGWIESGDPKSMARSIEKIVKREGEGAKGRILNTPKKMLAFWEKVGNTAEMAARVQLYSNLKEKGMSHQEAAFEARDLLDFYLSGASNAVRVMNAVIPFLNARVQGLDRLYRGFKNDKASFLMKGALVSAASLMLWSLFKDDDRYKELEDWDKWQYHHFWIGDQHFRIPKAFEVGAIFSSLFESFANVAVNNEGWDYFGRFLQHTLTETFAINMPQAFGPAIEVFANKSLFTGRNIESYGMQFLPAGKRQKPWTPEILKALGEGTNISPIKMEYLIKGYTSTFGTLFLSVTDSVYRSMADVPERPAMSLDQAPALGRFVRGETKNTKYATRFYDFTNDLDELTAEINFYKKSGDFKAARELSQKSNKLKYKRVINIAESRIKRLRLKEEQIWASRLLSASQKREQLDSIAKEKNKIYKEAYEKIND